MVKIIIAGICAIIVLGIMACMVAAEEADVKIEMMNDNSKYCDDDCYRCPERYTCERSEGKDKENI